MKTQIYKFKHPALLLLTTVMLLSNTLLADGLNPTIINGDLLLCPNTGETLITQQYETYQWYKNGAPIPNATGQTYDVNYYEDAGSTFSVFVTQGTQSAMSPEVLVDGYVFLPLVVMSYGDGYWVTYNGDEGYFHMCSYHELTFEIMMPYTVNLQWYKNGAPIDGANDAVYTVNGTGVYFATGSPAICPNVVEYSYLLDVTVYNPEKPVISQSSDTLFTSVMPGQWYSGSDPIPGATAQFLVPGASGSYSFLHVDAQGCEAMSDDYYYEWEPLGSGKIKPEREPHLYVAGNYAVVNNAAGWNYQILSITGSLLQQGVLDENLVPVAHLNKGFYLLRLENQDKVKVLKFLKN